MQRAEGMRLNTTEFRLMKNVAAAHLRVFQLFNFAQELALTSFFFLHKKEVYIASLHLKFSKEFKCVVRV